MTPCLRVVIVCVAIGFLVPTSEAGSISFGIDGQQFVMDFETIGNPGNSADTTGIPSPAGNVGYSYAIGKYEVSQDMINKFNASQSFQVSSVGWADGLPASLISWNEAARFVNWMNTSTGFAPAYKFSTNGANDNIDLWTPSDLLDYNPTNPYRSIRARYALPNYNEWYKAAYYEPTSGTYFDFANGSDIPPVAVSSGTLANTAVYNQGSPAEVMQAGGLSPYGIMGLGGNVIEWLENPIDLNNYTITSPREFRGGQWDSPAYWISSSGWGNNYLPGDRNAYIGFRVVSLESAAVPEPATLAVVTVIGIGGYVIKKRTKTRVNRD